MQTSPDLSIIRMATTPTLSISPYGSYTSTTGINVVYALVLTASEAFYEVKWYYTPPGGTESWWDTQFFYNYEKTSTCWISFYDGTGEYEGRAEVRLYSTIGDDVPNATYTVTVE